MLPHRAWHRAALSRIFLPFSKVWDTDTGNVLHSFPHNHIVRTVALSPNATHLLTGGQEKKVRMFDLTRPDAEPELLLSGGSPTSHDGTVKSVVWVGDFTGVSAGEDGVIKCVHHLCIRSSPTDHRFAPDGGICALGISSRASHSRTRSARWSCR